MKELNKELNQISCLLAEAARAGDLEQVAICEKALDGDADAMAECRRVIQDARAQWE